MVCWRRKRAAKKGGEKGRRKRAAKKGGEKGGEKGTYYFFEYVSSIIE
jgi:hypothetical protein